ncbi:MAG: TonB-dependent receptor [Steroidobacteraceae bacterium]
MPESRWTRKYLLLLAVFALFDATAEEAPSLLDLSIEELANLQVTSASRVEESLRDAAAAVFVITADDIRRSGVTSIPEALRLAPGVEVARLGTHSWSISIRGFNSNVANKLLVLIDGRSVYSPLYAGVFWDVQDTLLEDIDRIEVISGPGGALWGANAFNGVVNIITRSAGDTDGGFAEVLGGDEDRLIAGLRYGGKIGEDVAARLFVKYVDRDAGGGSLDEQQFAQGGFRLDWGSEQADRFTVQGDIYDGGEPGEFRGPFTLGTVPTSTFRDRISLAGGNLLGRWSRSLSEDANLALQFYYDHTHRDIPGTFAESRDTFDFDFQHHRRLGDRNDFLWGLGYRSTRDQIDNTLFVTFNPDHREDQTFSLFVQDKIALLPDKLFLTIGSKFEENDYTGTEVQPNLRLAWRFNERHTFWSSASRAVRIPSRLDADLTLTAPITVPGIPFPLYVNVNGNHDFRSEELLAYEAGYRIQSGENLSFDFSVFRNEYDELQTIEPQAPIFVLVPPLPYIILPNVLANGMDGHSTGGTFVASWEPRAGWRLRFQYAYFDLDLQQEPTSQDTSAVNITGNSPRHQAAIHSFMDLSHDLSFYAGLRYVDELPNQGIDSYTAVDVNLGWRLRNALQASIAVQNLADDGHLEFGGGNELERTVYLKIVWTFGK